MKLTEPERLFLATFSQSSEAKQLREFVGRIILEVKDDVLEETLSPKEGKVVIAKLEEFLKYLGLQNTVQGGESNFV